MRPVISILALCVVLAGAAYWMWGGGNLGESSSDGAGNDQTFALLSQEEISTIDPTAPATKPEKERALKVTNASGPGIKVSAPAGFSLTSPVDFDIQLEPKDGVAVDMQSIRIDYRLGPAWVNLTGRIMKQATIKGSRLVARGAELPPGNHTLRLTARDAQSRTTRATVSFSVAK